MLRVRDGMSTHREALRAMLAEWDRLDKEADARGLTNFALKVELLVTEAQRQRRMCINGRGYDPAPYLGEAHNG